MLHHNELVVSTNMFEYMILITLLKNKITETVYNIYQSKQIQESRFFSSLLKTILYVQITRNIAYQFEKLIYLSFGFLYLLNFLRNQEYNVDHPYALLEIVTTNQRMDRLQFFQAINPR